MSLGPLEILVVGFPTLDPGPDVAEALASGLLVGGAAYSTGKHGAMAKEQEASQNQQIADLQQQQAAQAAPPPPPPPAPAAGDADPMARLNQLAQLRQQGLLTDEEFTAAKAKIIGI